MVDVSNCISMVWIGDLWSTSRFSDFGNNTGTDFEGGECIVGVMVRPIVNLFHTRHVAINLAMSPKFTDATDVLHISSKIFLHLTMNFDHSGQNPGLCTLYTWSSIWNLG